MNGENEEKLTSVDLAQRILSKSNLGKIFDILIERPILISNGYEFFHNILDILSRQLSAPVCTSLIAKNDIEQMQVIKNNYSEL